MASDCTAVETGFSCSGGDASTADACQALCATGTMYNDTQSQCVVNTTATDVFDETNCATGTVYNDTQSHCVVDTTLTCGPGTVYDNDTLKKCAVDTGKRGLALTLALAKSEGFAATTNALMQLVKGFHNQTGDTKILLPGKSQDGTRGSLTRARGGYYVRVGGLAGDTCLGAIWWLWLRASGAPCRLIPPRSPDSDPDFARSVEV